MNMADSGDAGGDAELAALLTNMDMEWLLAGDEAGPSGQVSCMQLIL